MSVNQAPHLVIDLTHTIREHHSIWPGRPRFCRKTITLPGDVRKENYEIGCDTCTHVDAPAHFIPGGRTISDLRPKELTCPLVVFDVSARCAHDHLYELSVQDVEDWEARHGHVPSGALACMRSGWDKRFEDNEDYQNHQPTNHTTEFLMHFPGFSLDAARLLVEERGVAGLGIDTLSTDIGTTKTFPVHRLVLGASRFQVENMDLHAAPEAGALAVVSPMKIEAAPEAPARVLALVPQPPPLPNPPQAT